MHAFKVWRCWTDRIWVPGYRLLWELILHEAHNSTVSGHFGVEKTQQKLTQILFMARHARGCAAACGFVQNLPNNEIIEAEARQTERLNGPIRRWSS
ncbi:hypothetical protein CLOM_g3472 [Closterium sp. NIES-68]|nr:hypothetical protein CLOM_g3472 [Closterium sp. NIES-68]